MIVAIEAGPLKAGYELLPGFIVGLVLCVVVSLLTEAPSKEIVEEFESI